MATLERVTQLQQEGQLEPQIIQTLQQEGVSPKEINDALSQSKIKSAISNEQSTETLPAAPEQPGMQANMAQPSAMPPQQEMQANMAQPSAMPPQQEMQASIQPNTMPEPPTNYGAYSEESAGYEQPGAYGTEGEYGEEPYGGGVDIETINEISEQIVEEKTAKIKKQMSSFSRFQEDIKLETQSLNERIKKIENTINELQMAIIGKIGEYGNDIQNISKEMHATQDAFSKILNPLTDTIRKVESLETKSKSESKKRETKPIIKPSIKKLAKKNKIS